MAQLPNWIDRQRFQPVRGNSYIFYSRRGGVWYASFSYDGKKRRIPVKRIPAWGEVRRALRAKTFKAHKSGVIGITYEFLFARLALARRRAKKAGREFSITVADLYEIGKFQRWRCALTYIPFDCARGAPWRNPFTLSIDRIDNAEGYIKDNIRLVIHGLNVALGPWGEDVYLRIAQAYIRRQKICANKRVALIADDQGATQ